MKKIHIAVIAALLGLAAILGTFAATRTVHLGASSARASDATIARRAQQLNAFEASLRRQLAAKPGTARPGAAPAAPAPRIVYHRPPPIVVVRHTQHGEDGFEAEDGHEGGDD